MAGPVPEGAFGSGRAGTETVRCCGWGALGTLGDGRLGVVVTGAAGAEPSRATGLRGAGGAEIGAAVGEGAASTGVPASAAAGSVGTAMGGAIGRAGIVRATGGVGGADAAAAEGVGI